MTRHKRLGAAIARTNVSSSHCLNITGLSKGEAPENLITYLKTGSQSARKFVRYKFLENFGMNVLGSVLKTFQPRIDDDFVDRLNYYYTSSAMIILAILVSAKQYMGHPIECWIPATFTLGMEQYAENYCWVQNTFWLPFNQNMPFKTGSRTGRQIGYYQWVPFLLAIQALMFYLPTTLWRLLNTQSGINLRGILQMVTDDTNIESENRNRTVNILSRHIDETLRHQRDFGNKQKSLYLWACIKLGKFYGAYLSLLYCFVKILYLTNVFGQFFLLNRFLETDDYSFFGANVFWDMLHGRDWLNSGKFPRVTLCDFEIRVLGNVQRHTVQCVLVINMFTEKIFIFLWMLFLVLTIGTLISLMFWSFTLVSTGCRIRTVLKYLELTENPPDAEADSQLLRRFVMKYLRLDGVFILRMVSIKAGQVTASEITQRLWQKFNANVQKCPTIYETTPSTPPAPPEFVECAVGTDDIVFAIPTLRALSFSGRDRDRGSEHGDDAFSLPLSLQGRHPSIFVPLPNGIIASSNYERTRLLETPLIPSMSLDAAAAVSPSSNKSLLSPTRRFSFF